MFTLLVTEYLLIWLQPLELTYLYLLQKNYLMYMQYFLYLKVPQMLTNNKLLST